MYVNRMILQLNIAKLVIIKFVDLLYIMYV